MDVKFGVQIRPTFNFYAAVALLSHLTSILVLILYLIKYLSIQLILGRNENLINI